MRAALLVLSAWVTHVALAQEQAQDGAVLEVRFTATPRAQIAIWIEDGEGRFLRTLALTEAVGYRGIGNRPGASQMNSSYRWPYGRREGVLPIWATRRAAAPEAKVWKRVIFQNRREGHASQGPLDQSVDDYFCLSFDPETTTREALDAVSCASVFSSDKGRFITDNDLNAGYAEPFEPTPGTGSMTPLPLDSLYPPRMDVDRCTASGCYDHEDADQLASHAREVMPDIDAVTMATPPGGVPQSMLFTLPSDWPQTDYVVWVEVGVEGDYNASFDPTTFPTPLTPGDNIWDFWARTTGYPYRGQPSVAYAVPIALSEPGMSSESVAEAIGRSSWDVWDAGYGELLSMSSMSDDHVGAQGSGADRLLLEDGKRLTVNAEVLELRALVAGEDPWDGVVTQPSGGDTGLPPHDGDPPDDGNPDAPVGGAGGSAGAGAGGIDDPEPNTDPDDEPLEPGDEVEPTDDGMGVILPHDLSDDTIGAVRDMRISNHSNKLRSHSWVELRFTAPELERTLHSYEVRFSTEPIVDERTFIREGREAKTASDDDEGAVALMLPTSAAPGELVRGTIGDLTASTRYYIAVRAIDQRNRTGPISVAAITTTKRTFATVTPCFIATAAYGTTLAPEVSVLRRVRDRYLMPSAFGRALVETYYAHSPALAERVRRAPWLAASVRVALWPLVTTLSWLER